MESVDIVECAWAIQPYLTDLLAVNATTVEQELARLLTSASAGQKVDNLILAALSQHTPTREWARRYLQGDADPSGTPKDLRDYSQPPGVASPVTASGPRYVCPKCGQKWIRRAAGQTPPPCTTPNCPRFGKSLERVTIPT